MPVWLSRGQEAPLKPTEVLRRVVALVPRGVIWRVVIGLAISPPAELFACHLTAIVGGKADEDCRPCFLTPYGPRWTSQNLPDRLAEVVIVLPCRGVDLHGRFELLQRRIRFRIKKQVVHPRVLVRWRACPCPIAPESLNRKELRQGHWQGGSGDARGTAKELRSEHWFVPGPYGVSVGLF